MSERDFKLSKDQQLALIALASGAVMSSIKPEQTAEVHIRALEKWVEDLVNAECDALYWETYTTPTDCDCDDH